MSYIFLYNTINFRGKVNSHLTVVYLWWPVFLIYINVQLKYTNNNNISNVQTSDYAPTMVVIVASYRFNSSRPIAVHRREPDFQRLLEHIIIIIFRDVVGFSKSSRSYPLYVYVHVTLWFIIYIVNLYIRDQWYIFFRTQHNNIIMTLKNKTHLGSIPFDARPCYKKYWFLCIIML